MRARASAVSLWHGARLVATAAVGALAVLLASLPGTAFAEDPPDPCATPAYLLFGDSQLEVSGKAAAENKALKIVVLGGPSSTLPGPNGASFAYPARLEAALTRRLPTLKISVATELTNRQTAEEMSKRIANIVTERKPDLVIWQTGSYDALRGTDPEEFRASVSDGVEKLRAAGVDVVLLNMQYSPRTETVVNVGAYADSLRWVAREREVPVFDRLAIMRHWYENGQFDLYTATKDMKTAKTVHDCLGRTLASSIIDAARLETREGAAPQ